MDIRYYFTKRGLEKLRKEIDELTTKLKDLQSKTAYIAEVGGNQYHDNASYEMLIIDIRGVDWRLTEAHRCLNHAVIIESPKNIDRVTIGTRVKFIRDGKETTWEIVGFGESDPKRKLLAYNTPIASLLIGKQTGEIVSGIIAGRQTEIEILEISKGGADEDS